MASARLTASRGSDSGLQQQKRAQWSNQTYTVEELLEQFTLPQIVKCNPQAILVKKDSPLPVNLGQPILLFESRTVRKLLAKNVVPDPATGKFTESEDTVVIPRDYDGSFLRLRSRTSKDDTPHNTMESLVQNNVKAFLNLTKLSAYKVMETQNGAPGDFPRMDYLPGNVFVIDNIYHGSAKMKYDGKVLLHKNSGTQQMKFVKCRDDKDNNILISATASGEFAEILPNDMNSSGRLSVKSEDLIDKQKFPIIVRYIRGRFKPRLTSFSGLFTLLDSFEETTVVGCVLDKSGYTLLEVPMSFTLSFHLALNLPDLQSHPVVRNGLKLCEKAIPNFAHDLKFKFKFAQRYLQMGPRKKTVVDEDDPGESPSAHNSARVGVTQTYLYV